MDRQTDGQTDRGVGGGTGGRGWGERTDPTQPWPPGSHTGPRGARGPREEGRPDPGLGTQNRRLLPIPHGTLFHGSCYYRVWWDGLKTLGCCSCSLNLAHLCPSLEGSSASSPTSHSAPCRGQAPWPQAATGQANASQTAQEGPPKPACCLESSGGRRGRGWVPCVVPTPDSGTVTHRAGLLPRSVGLCLQGKLGKAAHGGSSLPPPWRAGNYFYILLAIKHAE